MAALLVEFLPLGGMTPAGLPQRTNSISPGRQALERTSKARAARTAPSCSPLICTARWRRTGASGVPAPALPRRHPAPHTRARHSRVPPCLRARPDPPTTSLPLRCATPASPTCWSTGRISGRSRRCSATGAAAPLALHSRGRHPPCRRPRVPSIACPNLASLLYRPPHRAGVRALPAEQRELYRPTTRSCSSRCATAAAR